MFWKFLLGGAIASVIFPFIFALLIGPFIVALGWLSPRANKAVIAIAATGCGIWTLLVLCGWVSLLVWMVRIGGAESTHRWIYHILALGFLLSPLTYMAGKERSSASSERDNSGLWFVVVIAAYIVFAVWPSLTLPLYGWFLRWFFDVAPTG